MSDPMFNEEELVFEETDFLKNQKPQLNVFQRFLNVFTAPSKTFEDVDVAPRILVPMLIVFVLFLGISAMNWDALVAMQEEALANSLLQTTGEVPTESLSIFVTITSVVGLVVGAGFILISIVIKSAFVRGIATFMNGEGQFKRIFSALLYAYGIVLAGMLLRQILVMALGLDGLSFSLGMLLPADSNGVLVAVLNAFEFFTLWYLFVSAVAIKIIERISFKKALVCSVVPFAVNVMISIVISQSVV